VSIVDPYTAEARLCDDVGMVSRERVPLGEPGTAFDPDLTYRQGERDIVSPGRTARRHG
jgi:hypothetical protein